MTFSQALDRLSVLVGIRRRRWAPRTYVEKVAYWGEMSHTYIPVLRLMVQGVITSEQHLFPSTDILADDWETYSIPPIVEESPIPTRKSGEGILTPYEEDIRTAVADYLVTVEHANYRAHAQAREKAERRVAELLHVSETNDETGFDWRRYESDKKTGAQ